MKWIKGYEEALYEYYSRKGAMIDQLVLAMSRDNPQDFEEAIRGITDLDANLDAVSDLSNNDSEWTLMHITAWDEAVNCIDVLLKHGASIEIGDKFSQSPLHIAAYGGKVTSLKHLISLGADIESRDNREMTPLCSAVENRKPLSAKILLDAGADPNKKDKWGNTPLHWAARHSGSDTVKLLLDHGAIIDLKNNNGETALKDARLYKAKEVAKVLINRGLDPFLEFKDFNELLQFFDGDLSWYDGDDEDFKRRAKASTIRKKLF